VALTAIVLGAAAGGGVPQWNCRCSVCELAWSGDVRVTARTQAGLAISVGDGRFVLINASPDLRQQIQATPALHPPGPGRGSPIDAVVLTGGEIDQIAGLLSLRENSPFTLYATGDTYAAIGRNAMFSALAATTRRTVGLGEPFALREDLSAELFAVPGKMPLYLESESPTAGNEANAGIELRAGGKKLVFVPAAAAVTREMWERLLGAHIVLFDGTFYTDDEMQVRGVGSKTARRMGHMPVGGSDGSLAALHGLKARRIYVHINNTNPMLVTGSRERAAAESAGWEIAEDGMELVL